MYWANFHGFYEGSINIAIVSYLEAVTAEKIYTVEPDALRSREYIQGRVICSCTHLVSSVHCSAMFYHHKLVINPFIYEKSVLFKYRLSAEEILDPSCVAPQLGSSVPPSLRDAWGSSHHWSGIFSASLM